MGTTITKPVINGPYDEPRQHFKFDNDGITDEIVTGRRRSECFVSVPQTKKRGAQLQFDNEWTLNRIQPNDFIYEVRARVDLWRKRGYQNVTPTTRWLLGYWADEHRENRVLFAQRDAAETAIYLTEAAQKDSQGWMLTRLDEVNAEFNAGLPRVDLKMATGSCKTVVMTMVHHCCRDKPAERVESEMDADEMAEAKDREEQARVWFKGLQALRVKLGIKTVYDLSATPPRSAGCRSRPTWCPPRSTSATSPAPPRRCIRSTSSACARRRWPTGSPTGCSSGITATSWATRGPGCARRCSAS